MVNHLLLKPILATLLLLSLSEPVYGKAIGDRCANEECLCYVRPGGPPFSKVFTETSSRSASVLFEEASSLIDKRQRDILYNFFTLNKKLYRTASIIGYTDGCGTEEYNKKLSLDRAIAVRDIATRAGFSNLKIISAGERSASHSASSRRVDIIFHTDRAFTTRIEKLPADYYLVDASGSMWDQYKKWTDIISASVKPNSKIYLSTTDSCVRGAYMSQVSPGGPTEIWWSYWHIIGKMKPGETLLIISDFESRFPLSKHEASLIVERVKEAKIIVYSAAP